MQIIEIAGDSMYPTLKPGQLLITKNVSPTHINRGRIVVFSYLDKPLLKRIIGMPNEKVELKSNSIYINDTLLEEPYLDIERSFFEDFLWQTRENEVILLGDNTLNSLDSRKFGPVEIGMLRMRPVFRIWPPKYIH